MYNFFNPNRIIIQTFFLSFIFFSTNSYSVEKIYKNDYLSNYFSGIISLNNQDYESSLNFLKRLDELENNHVSYSRRYLSSLVNTSNISEAVKYSLLLKKKKINYFQSDLIIISKLIKNNQFDLAQKALIDLKKNNEKLPLQQLLFQTILNWVEIENNKLNFNESKKKFDGMDTRFKNITKIQEVFLNCYFDTPDAKISYENLINTKTTDFTRYTFFYVNYLLRKNLKKESVLILDKSLTKVPRNLLLNQLKIDLEKNKIKKLNDKFNCRNVSNIIAELFYVTANALSTQSLYSASNYYINISKYLNTKFVSYDSLVAENYYYSGKISKAKMIYSKMSKFGEIFNWHSSKQIAAIIIEDEKNSKKALDVVNKTFARLAKPNLYQIYDYAAFLKNNEKYDEAVKYYSDVISVITKEHELYAKALDGRGISYERLNFWDKAERDFLESLRVKPNQAYVLNYLAYSWIEKGIKINQSLDMLKKADRIRSEDGYITDSLGWALFKLKKYSKAKTYLQKAIQIMPADPVINDHFADSLWMNGNKLQARYYWNYVLDLEDTDKELREKISDKIVFGLKN